MVSIPGKRELRLQMEVRLLIKWTSNGEIILDYPGEPKVTTGSWKVEKGRGRQSGSCDYVRRSVVDGSTQLAIAGFEDAERGPWAKECRWLPESGRHSPGTILTFTQWDPFRTSKPESCNLNLCCFKATTLVVICSCSNRKSCSVTSPGEWIIRMRTDTAFFLSLAVLFDF